MKTLEQLKQEREDALIIANNAIDVYADANLAYVEALEETK